MSKKHLILPWTLVVLLSFGIAALLFLYQDQKNNVQQTSSSSSVSSTNTQSSVSSDVSSIAPSSSSSEDQTPEQALQSDIELAAAQTQLMTSISIKSSRLENETSYVVPSTGKYVYLTFDDGPSENTPGVLEILKKNKIKATFFVVYNKNKEYYRQIVEDGQTLALHTYTHDYKKVYSSVNDYFSDLDKISDYVKEAAGIDSRIVRLPGGSSNTISRHYCKGVMTSVTEELQKRGYSYYDWNAQCLDATTENITASQILKNVKSFTEINGVQKPYIMLLLHNASTETATKDALQSIIDYYRSLGYQFEAITPDTPAVHMTLQN
jgi:peptidoglycan-N-acetylglucosamine deacetylase